MTTLNKTNINISSINALPNTNEPLNNITINNSIKIPKTPINVNNVIDNSNAGILVKDVNSIDEGSFYRIKVDSYETDVPYLYFNGNVVIDSNNLLSELENELINNNRVLETSNIIVHGGYINFYNGTNENTNQGNTGVGLRYSSDNTVQFKNYDTDWIDLVDITKHDQFSELIDVDVHTNPLQNNQYITYNSISNLFVNSNLAIVNDIHPQLGGDLNIGNHILQFGTSESRFVYNDSSVINNNLLVLKNNSVQTDFVNYLEINNTDSGVGPGSVIEINAKSFNNIDNSDGVGINISSVSFGNINLNTEQGNINLNAVQGDIYTNSDSLVISGFIKSSIFRTSSVLGGYHPNTYFSTPISSDTILFDFTDSSQSGTYWSNIDAGVDGQKLNIIYNNRGSNAISVLANFGSNGILIGTGYKTGLEFTTSGQSSSLIYLGEGIDAWQILNTGSSIF